MSKVKIEEVTYGDFGKCARIYNETTEVLVTVDIGPRIIRYAMIGKENVFCEHYTKEATSKETGWKIYGGHRLWHSPEDSTRTYAPDNSPVEYAKIENGIQILCAVEESTGLQKSMVVILSEEETDVAVIHGIINRNPWAVEYAAWAVSVMAPGGKEIIPMDQTDTGLLHNRSISLWSYAKMNDERVNWGEKYITLKQDVNCGDRAFKLGITNNLEWAVYFNNNQAFAKRYIYFDGETYPDNGVSYETYTNNFMLEMESLSPLSKVEQGEIVEHIELWAITPDVKMPEDDEESIEKALSETYIPESLGDDCGCGDDGCDCGEDGCGDDCTCDDDGCGCGDDGCSCH